MRVILAYVASLDGMITDGKGRSPAEWASREDQIGFQKLVRASDAVVMGANTYLAHRDAIRASTAPKRVVMTSEPERFARDTKDGLLEFTDRSPKEVLMRLKRSGAGQVLLASGPKLTNEFLDQKLVDELHLTVEPVIFGNGTHAAMKAAQMKLISAKKLNKTGTLLLRYEVLG